MIKVLLTHTPQARRQYYGERSLNGLQALAQVVLHDADDALDAAGLIEAVRLRRPDADPATLVATGWGDARKLIEAYVAAGISKFVIRPAGTPASLDRFVEDFAREMMPLQN